MVRDRLAIPSIFMLGEWYENVGKHDRTGHGRRKQLVKHQIE